jgi:hypothetical protein
MENEKQEYIVTVVTELSYDIVVKAESFNDAARAVFEAIDGEDGIESRIVRATMEIVPEGCLNWDSTDVHGVNKI